MNVDDNSYEGHLKASEKYSFGKVESELSRTKFSSAVHERNESIQLFEYINSFVYHGISMCNKSNKRILVIYKFVNGLRDREKKRFVLQKRKWMILYTN